MFTRLSIIATTLLSSALASAETIEPIRYGDFNSWVTRNLTESIVIGGNDKKVYEIGPNCTIDGNKAYSPMGGSPWATSNVYAKVSGVTKTSNTVFPYNRSNGNSAAKLCSMMETVKALGIIKMDVMVAGSIFLGRMYEPITSTKNPYTKMEVGQPYTKRPKAFIIDYKVDMPSINNRIKSSGFGSKKTLPGRDTPVIFIMLQRRWEDSDGNLHARRVATGGEKFPEATQWINGHRIPLHYGDCSKTSDLQWVGLRDKTNAYYAKNSKGKMMPVIEEGWDNPESIPTHVIVMISSGNGEPYVATPGVNFYVDNAGFVF